MSDPAWTAWRMLRDGDGTAAPAAALDYLTDGGVERATAYALLRGCAAEELRQGIPKGHHGRGRAKNFANLACRMVENPTCRVESVRRCADLIDHAAAVSDNLSRKPTGRIVHRMAYEAFADDVRAVAAALERLDRFVAEQPLPA